MKDKTNTFDLWFSQARMHPIDVAPHVGAPGARISSHSGPFKFLPASRRVFFCPIGLNLTYVP